MNLLVERGPDDGTAVIVALTIRWDRKQKP